MTPWNAPNAPFRFHHLSTAPTSITLRVPSQDTLRGSEEGIGDAFFHLPFVKREKSPPAAPLPAHDHPIPASDLTRYVRARTMEHASGSRRASHLLYDGAPSCDG